MSKRHIAILAALLTMMVLLVATPSASAARLGGYWTFSSGLNTFIGSGTPAFRPLTGAPGSITASPHRGYTTATAKCKVCHAVHGAGMTDASGNVTTERLLRSTVADACTFCHLTSSYASNPYVGYAPWTPNPVANYAGTSQGSGHYSQHAGTPYEGCNSCHSVHGAETMGTGQRILKNDPAKGVISDLSVNSGWGSRIAPVETMSDFCLDCHDGTQWIDEFGTPTSIDSPAEFAAQFPNCSGCHNSASTSVSDDTTQFGVAMNLGHDGRSHPMTTDTFGFDGETIVAGSVTLVPGAEGPTYTSCSLCHNVDARGDFPHFLARYQALIVGYQYSTQLDGVCLGCHSQVGHTF